MKEASQQVEGSGNQVAGRDIVHTETHHHQTDIRFGEGAANQTINIGAVYTGPMHIHINLTQERGA